jgi:hypothetical protein
MTTFDDRVQAFEAKFAHDLDLRFQARARCNKLLGLWAAGLLNLTGAEAEGYADEVVTADLQHPGHEDVVNKISSDMGTQHISGVSREDIKAKMAEFLTQATAEMLETT